MSYFRLISKNAWLVLFLPKLVFSLSFTDPLFENLGSDLLARQAELASKSDRDAAAEVELRQVEFFIAERNRFLRKVHAASQGYHRLSDSCSVWENEAEAFSSLPAGETRSTAAYLCALTHLALIDESANAWSEGAQSVKALRDVEIGNAKGEMAARWYIEGRIYASLPAAFGRDFGKALLALAMLRRSNLSASSPIYFQARAYELQGNYSKAQSLYAEALTRSPPDTRASYQFADNPTLSPDPETVDGLSWGFSPGVFASPSKGLGARISLFDDRLFDTSRSVMLRASAATRGVYNAGVRAEDQALLQSMAVELEADYSYGTEDFFGLGPGTPLSDHTLLTVQRFQGSLGVRQEAEKFYLGLGWRISQARVLQADGSDFFSLALPQSRDSNVNGPWGEIGYDNRDSRYAPTRGVWIAARGWFPMQGWQMLSGEARGYLSLSAHTVLSARATIVTVDAKAPFQIYPKLGGSLGMPATRDARFQDRSVFGGVAEGQQQLTGPLSAALFVNAGTVAPEVSQLFSSPWQVGGGAGLIWQPGRYRSQYVRLEGGYFGGETLLSVAGGKDF